MYRFRTGDKVSYSFNGKIGDAGIILGGPTFESPGCSIWIVLLNVPIIASDGREWRALLIPDSCLIMKE
jgi:hypothetical protein